ncbi:MAG: outer membrane beta-barrel protein [Melioribacter sp.]|uniref:outer membrane protein n=1 Tax=Rosettibacter primus TaxID=3111523 RepID=UPI00247C7484|nr:outer membrane beta-barrel protein [Melioribacter sp.]
MSRIIKTILVFIFLFNFGVTAQTDIGLKGVGVKLGYVAPEDPIENTIGFGAAANLGTITSNIHLDAVVDFWSKTYGDLSPYGKADFTFTEITIAALGKYYFPLESSSLKPYAGAGIGFVIGRTSFEYNIPYIGSGSESESETNIGFRVLGGVDYKLSPQLNAFAEVFYHTDGADFLGIFAGVVYCLGK